MGTYDIREDIWARSWFCLTSCKREFEVRRLRSPLAPARAIFDSQLNYIFFKWRHAWFMHLVSESGALIAEAKQRFFLGGRLGFSALSRWTLEIREAQARQAGLQGDPWERGRRDRAQVSTTNKERKTADPHVTRCRLRHT
mmetsp:Transcript_35094/g.96972  ORF Transcript_35094/g.96972 Transcript_35094/m.96972 type:complete len:141 (-) Transcript_35094:314-736(-)